MEATSAFVAVELGVGVGVACRDVAVRRARTSPERSSCGNAFFSGLALPFGVPGSAAERVAFAGASDGRPAAVPQDCFGVSAVLAATCGASTEAAATTGCGSNPSSPGIIT
ncbi:hypothetical protein JYK22_10655, partial [Nonomuraea sp. RK-328]|nr:hypothetical protein [Nonomuraea sp. RK-328]